jgi:hypothetical protein
LPTRSRTSTLGASQGPSQQSPRASFRDSTTGATGSPSTQPPSRSRSSTGTSGPLRPSQQSPQTPNRGLTTRTSIGSSTQPSVSSNQQPAVILRTFRVIRQVTLEDIPTLERTTSLSGFMVVEIGAFGLIPNIQSNLTISGGFIPYPVVKVYHHTKSGPEPLTRSPLSYGKCRIPLSHIEIGAVYTTKLKVVGGMDLVRQPISPTTDDLTSSPLRIFLQTFLKSMVTAPSQTFLLGHAVHSYTFSSIEPDRNQQMFTRAILDGQSLLALLYYFSNLAV